MDSELAGVLATDPARLSHDERLELLEHIEHMRSAIDAQAQVTLALLARDGDAEYRAKEWVREEVAVALSVAPVTAAARLHDAVQLVERLPLTLDRLVDGSITMGHVRALVDAVGMLDDDTTAKVEKRVIPKAQGQTIGEFRQRVKRAVASLDPRRAEQQHEDAVAQRRVGCYFDEHGMATVWAHMRADAAMALITALDAHASQLPRDDGRTIDQMRADVLADLATLAMAGVSTKWQGRRPAIQVSIAFSTLTGLDDQPGELDGYGPIPASMAREIAHDPSGTWRRLLTDHVGRLIEHSPDTYRPPAALRDHVIAEYKTCTFAGCRRAACRGELDHIKPFGTPGGKTVKENLQPPCKRHYIMKHQTNWTVRKSPDCVTWTSPSGREFDTPMHSYPIDTTSDPPPF
jgi:hypothetical protein